MAEEERLVRIEYGVGFEFELFPPLYRSCSRFSKIYTRGTAITEEQGVPIMLAEICSHENTTFLLNTLVEL